MFEDYYQPEFDADYFNSPAFQRGIAAAVEQYYPNPVEPVYYAPPPEPVYYAPEPVYTPAVAPMIVEAEPVMGIGSPAVAAQAAAPSVIEAPAAGGSLTQEQYDAMADRRAAANALPRGTYIAAPTDNLGKGTGFDTPGEAPNTFQYRGGPIRVTDRKGKVLFSGEGPEGALEAVKFAQNLSDTKGKKASWDIQQGERTINPDGSEGPMRWVSGPTDAKEGMGLVGDLAAFALPIAAAVLTAGMSLPAQMAIASAAGMVGGVMSGNDPLKAAIIAGVSAGVMDKIGANEFIGEALNNVSSAVTNTFASKAAQETAEEVVKKAVEEVGEEIVVTAISRTMQGVANSVGNTLLSEVAKQVRLGDVTGYQTPAEKFAEEKLPETLQTPAPTPVEDAIVVSGKRINPVADIVADVVSGIGSAAAADVINQPAATEPSKTAEEIEEEKTGDIVSLGKKTPSVNVPVPGIGTPGVVEATRPVETSPEEAPADDTIVVTAPQALAPTPPIPGFETAIPAIIPGALNPTQTGPAPEKSTLDKIKDAADVATTVLPIIGGIAGGAGGGDSGPLVPSGGTYDVNPNRSDVFGTRGIANIKFDPFTYGQATGNQPGEFMFFTRNPVTGQELLQSAPAPITTPVANEPAAPAGYIPSGNTFAEGGEINDDMASHLIAYHKNGGHTGPGQVKGIGSGQEDKIPAWLSDGEYVWSAQDVADLGDGSTDEGVRRLDKMRQMVRRRAGRKDVKKIAKPQRGIDHMLKAVGGSV